MSTIRITIPTGQDASLAAKLVAEKHGKKLEGNMRWRGLFGPQYRDILCTDGTTIAIYETMR